MKRLFLSLFLAGIQILILGLFSSALAQQAYYDELFENGKLRPQYQAIAQKLQNLSKKERETFLANTRRSFEGDNALDMIPRILLPSEAFQVQLGVEQRARALRAFLQDHYSGRKSYLFGNVIPKDILERILVRSTDKYFDGLISEDMVSFIYGPDIIRDAQGVWRVIEDNPGFVGGVGDLKLAHKLTMNHFPELRAEDYADPLDFYRATAAAYKRKAKEFGGIPIVYMEPPYNDNEDKRIRQLFQEQGIVVVTPNSVNQLKVRDDGVYVSSPDEGWRKVGYIFLNGEHGDIDYTQKSVRSQELIEAAKQFLEDPKGDLEIKAKLQSLFSEAEAKAQSVDAEEIFKLLNPIDFLDLPKPKAAGLVQAILDKKVGCNYSPGINFVGDKEFYLYVENMIRYYLKEAPILKNIHTEKFLNEKTAQFDSQLKEKVLANKDQYVLKKVDGRGGDSVWVGAKVSHEDLKQVFAAIERDPGSYIVQDFTQLSILKDVIVDMRWHASVLNDEIVLSETPWGRGLPLSGNGKVNLSDKGREITILVMKNEPVASRAVRCESVYAF